MASGRVRTGIRPGTDRHLSVPRSGRSGFGSIRSISRLPHRSVPKSCRSMSVLDHGQIGSGRSSLSQISEKSRSGTRASQDRPGFYYVDVTRGAVTGKWYRFTNGSCSLGLVGFAASHNKADARHYDLLYLYNPPAGG